MPGKVGVKIKAGRNLPVMDRGSDTTDAYVEIKLGNVTQKTDVCRKSLNPQWNTDWFRFELDDAELQDEPLQIRLMDHDTYSANDAIGKVNISLNPLCLENANVSSHAKGTVMSGWIPVFDTMHGIRGEVNVIVKIDLFSDANKFRQSSCGVQFFHSPNIPHGYRAQVIHGFVEELVVNDDPEYQWIDKIRTPRASNEARQVVFLRLSGQVQRKIGLKAINLGANAVIGYTQCFDLEGDVGVVARGIGTAVTLVKIQENLPQPIQDNALIEEPLEYLRSFERNKGTEPISKFDAETSSSSSNDIYSKILAMDASDTAAGSVVLKKWKSTDVDHAIAKELSENQEVRQLLAQEDERGEKPKTRLRHHVKNLKQSSKNLINDRLKGLKPKIKEDSCSDNTSLSSSYSDVSRSRTSLADLKGLLPFKRNKSNINRSTSEGCGMATLIVSSILRAPSLQSITESHDSETQKQHHSKAGSMLNLPIKKHDSPKLKPKKTQPSDGSGSTTSLSSSTTEEVASDSEATSPNEIVVVDADTVSMVMKTVLAQEEDEDVNEWIQPGTTQDDGSDRQIDKLSDSNCQLHRIGTKISIRNDPIAVSLTDLQSVNEDEAGWIEPGSTADEPEVDDRERRGSLLHDLKDNISEKFHQLQEHIHLPNFTDGKHKNHQHGLLETAMETMLIEKANLLGVDSAKVPDQEDEEEEEEETDAIENVSFSVPNSPKHDSKTASPKSDESKPASPKKSKTRTSLKRFNFSFCRKKKKSEGEIVNNSGLIGNAMATMLLEQVNFAEEICEQPQEPEKNGILPAISDSSSTPDKNQPVKQIQKPIVEIIIDPLTETPTSENWLPTVLPTSSIVVAPVSVDAASYYASEPHLPDHETVLGIPFTSLINLRVNPEMIDSRLADYLTTITNPPNPVVPPPSSPPPSITTSTFDVMSLVTIPHTVNIPPPLPPSSSLSASSQQKNLPPHHHHFHNHRHRSNNNRTSFVKSNNLNVATNTIKSSSYTDLSTNKAPTLAPFPSPKHCRSELASAAASPGRSPAAVTAAVPDQVKATTVSPVAPAAPTVASPAPTSTATGHTRAESLGGKFLQSPAKNPNSTTASGAQATTPMAAGNSQKKDNSEICRRSSDSDLSVTPKGNSICVASERLITATTLMRLTGPVKGSLNQENFDMLEYPFLTMTKYPSGFIVHLGATVAARSVKLLERVPNPDEPEVRDSWWKELRMEVRSHARSLGCNVVLGYTEVTAISDDVCVLSATGTAAVINMSYNGDPVQIDGNYSSKKDLIVSSLEDNRSTMKLQDRSDLTGSKEFSTSLGSGPKGATSNTSLHNYRCYMCHVPYSQSSVPFNVKMRKCAICKRGKVPDVLLTTIEIPECLQITGRGSFIQAQVVRAKRDLRSESNAKEISDGLPFLEYELHRLLINKLKAKGMNAIFALKTQVAIGEKMMALIATGTALYLSALPPPSVPKIVAGNSWTDTAKLNELQKSLQETFDRNREIYQLKCFESDMQNGKQSDTDDSEDELPEMDLGAGGKDACVLEIDDIEDLEIITLLMEPVPPDGFCVVNTQSVPGLQDMDVVKNLQMFTQIWRAKLMLGHSIGQFPKHFNRILQTIYFKLRTLIPCAICDLKFNLALPESDEIQLLVIGMALGLGDPSKSKIRRKTFSGSHTDNNNTPQGMNNNAAIKHSDEELIFSLDEDQTMNVEPVSAPPTVNTPPHFSNSFGAHSLRLRRTSPCRTSQFTASFKYSRHLPVHDRYGVDVTPLSYVAGGRIDKYLGNLNFFFIRESTSIRENGGISGFVHSFITEILAVVRAHVNALGGNAMVAFYMTELLLVDNQHKNQGQCLISIGGDVVHVSYFADD